MSENPSDDTGGGAGRGGPGWRPSALHFHIGAWSLVSVAIVALFLIFASMSLTGRVVALPAWVADKVEQEMNAALPEGKMALKRIELGATRKGRLRLRIVDVDIRDASGLHVAQFNSIEGGVRIAPLLRGDMVPRSVTLTGAQITFRRLADGGFALQFGQGDTTTGTLSDVLDALDVQFAEGIFADAQRVEALGLTITLEDARTGRIWQVTDGRLSMTQTPRLVETAINFDVFNQTDDLAEVEVALRSSKTDSAATLAVSFTNAAANDIGAQSPALSFLSLIDAPVSGALRTTLGPDGAISELAGAMSIEEGAIRPEPGADPVGFGGAKGYLDYDPDARSIELSGLTLSSDLGRIQAEGKLYLTDYQNDWPRSVVGQLRLNNALLNAPDLFDVPVEINDGYADMRLRLAPFELDIGQAVFFRGDTRINTSGRIGATRNAWDIALDVHVPQMSVAELKSLWPKSVSAKPRKWVVANVAEGMIHDAHMAFRGPTMKTAQVLMGGTITDARVKAMKTMPMIENASGTMSIADKKLVVSVDEGVMPAPNGIEMDVAGSSFTIGDVTQKPGVGLADVQLAGPLQGALSLLDLKPFDIFRANDFGPDVATGRVEAHGTVAFSMAPKTSIEEIDFDVSGAVFDVFTGKVVPGAVIRSERLDFTARPEAVVVSGAGRLGEAGFRASWRQPLAPDEAKEGSRLDGTVMLGQALVEALNLGLTPDILSGEAPARLQLALVPNEPLRITATSDLVGAVLAIPGTGWSKPAATKGALEMTATLGPAPGVDRLTLRAPGLDAVGSISTLEGGGLDAVRFSRVQLGGWLDAPVVLRGRGSGRPIGVEIRGGQGDLRNAQFSSGGGGSDIPLSISLDRLTIAKGIVLEGFNGDFSLSGGLSGGFTGRVEGGADIVGTVAKSANGAAYLITSARGGEVLRGLNIFDKARGGALEVRLVPEGRPGVFDGSFSLKNTDLVDAPAMAELLAAISVVGLLDQLDGGGISFTEVKGRFQLAPERVTLYNASAVSAALGLSLDGYYNLNTSTIDMQGVLSPFYLINSLGRVLSARDGEGLVGFNFTLTGPTDDIAVGVNPLSILAPGVLREIFRRQAPQAPGGAGE